MLQMVLREARALVAGLDVEAMSGAQARDLAAGFAELERLAAAGKLLATGRLVASGAGPGDDSFRDVDAWLASVSGTTVGAARATTKAATRALEQPVVEVAVRAGRLSAAQAELVTSAAAADADAAGRLVELASHAGVKGLRAECERVIAAAASRAQEQSTAEHVHAQRSLRHTARADGSGTITMTGPLDRTAAVMAALEPFEQAIFIDNRTRKTPAHAEATAFDAMVELAASARSRGPHATRERRPLATLHLHVSDDAFRRGHTERREICEIEGAGPVPVSTARRLSSDAILKALVMKGTDVTHVVSLGRTIPAALATAIRTEQPACSIEGCEIDRHLELDHNVPWAQGGETSRENVDPLCGHHHDVKTRRDLRRLGPPGRQRLVSVAEHEAALVPRGVSAPGRPLRLLPVAAHRLVDLLPLLALGARRCGIHPPFLVRELPGQLRVAREPGRVELARLHRGAHGAPRLGLVAAVAEPAALGELGDVGERGRHADVAVGAEAEAAQPGRVDDHATGRDRDQIARRGRCAGRGRPRRGRQRWRAAPRRAAR